MTRHPPHAHSHHHSRIRDSPNVPGTHGTLGGMFHAHSNNFPNNTLGATTGVTTHGAILRSGPPSMNTTEMPRVTQKDLTNTIATANKVKPQWDGDPTTWKQIFRDWEYDWELKGPTQDGNSEVIKMEFIDCLPKDERERAR